MSALGPTAGAYVQLQSGGVVRMTGQLAAGATITNGNTYRERLILGHNALTVDVRCKMTVSGGTPTIQVVPRTAALDADATAGLTSATSLTNGVEANHAYTTKGENVVDVVLDATPASAAGTLTYVDVLVKPLR